MKQKASDVKRELEEEQDEVYGEGSISGSAPDPEKFGDLDKVVKNVTGEEPGEGEPFSLAEEVEENEEARRTKPEDEGED